jgi:hypothetical protein
LQQGISKAFPESRQLVTMKRQYYAQARVEKTEKYEKSAVR